MDGQLHCQPYTEGRNRSHDHDGTRRGFRQPDLRRLIVAIAANGERSMKELLNLGQMLTAHARLSPDRIGARDLERTMTFRAMERALPAGSPMPCSASASPRATGSRVLAYNCVEWVEIYAATAKAGPGRRSDQLPPGRPGNPLHRRELPKPPRSSSRTTSSSVVEEIRANLPIPPSNFIHFGGGRMPGRVPRLRGR